jgi:hypothetical protein
MTRQFSAAPMGRTIRRSLLGGAQNFGFQADEFFLGNNPSSVSGIEPSQSLGFKPTSPRGNKRRATALTFHNQFIRLPLGQTQQNPRSAHLARFHFPRPRHFSQYSPLRRSQFELSG